MSQDMFLTTGWSHGFSCFSSKLCPFVMVVRNV